MKRATLTRDSGAGIFLIYLCKWKVAVYQKIDKPRQRLRVPGFDFPYFPEFYVTRALILSGCEIARERRETVSSVILRIVRSNLLSKIKIIQLNGEVCQCLI